MADFETFAEREKQGWATVEKFDSYEDYFAPVSAVFADDMMRHVKLDGAEVLDLCCGHGDMTARLSDGGARVTGLDFSQEALKRAQKRAPNATLVRGDAQDLPFADNHFDAVMCNLGLLHVPNRQKALSEIRRVLKPGGRFCNSSWAAPENNPAFRVALSSLRPNLHPDHPPPQQPDVFEFGSVEPATAALTQAGFRVVDTALSTAYWNFDTPDWLFHVFADATITVGSLIHSQPEANIEAIRAAMAEQVRSEFRQAESFRISATGLIVLAKPV